MSGTSDALSLIGRIFLAVIFVVSGFGKIGGFEGLVGQIASKGFPAAQVFAVATIVIEIGVGLMLVAGWKARWAAFVLAALYRHREHFLSQLLGNARSAENDAADSIHEESGADRRLVDGDCVWPRTFEYRQALGEHSLQKRGDIADLLFVDRVWHRILMPLDAIAGRGQRIARSGAACEWHDRIGRAVRHEDRHPAHWLRRALERSYLPTADSRTAR